MKILIVNNYLNNTLGGVENYLQALISFTKNKETEIEFKWFGVGDRKTKWHQKLKNQATTNAIITEIESFKPDLIHSFSIGATVTPHFMAYAKSKNIPVIHSFRDYYYICPKNYMLHINGTVLQKHGSFLECVWQHHPKKNIVFDGFLYLKQSIHKSIIKKNISYFLTPSNNLTQMIASEFKKPGETLPNPVLISNPFLNKKKADYLLFVGRLDKEKGVLTLLKAFQKILEKLPDEHLKIAGSGSFQVELEDYVSQNSIKNVTFVGNKNREGLMELYASAKFTIVPSEFLESYGNVILESFAFRKTVIISDLLGIQKEVFDSKSGLIFPFGNVIELTHSIEKLLIDNEFREELEQNAADYVAPLSFENHFQKLVSIYKKVLPK
jgi:glycosyltransferase involved in cell wall biosynthesis